jgi:hypothetical protein
MGGRPFSTVNRDDANYSLGGELLRGEFVFHLGKEGFEEGKESRFNRKSHCAWPFKPDIFLSVTVR